MANWRLLCISLLLVAPYAQAAGTSNEAKERAARKACLRGNVEKGVEILSDLYLHTEDANWIYNQGRCLEENHRYEDAVTRFREYLLKAPDLTEADKAQTQKHIALCLSHLGKAELPPAGATAPASPGPPQGDRQLGQVPAPPAQVMIQQPVEARSTGSGLRGAGVVTASVGGAALVTGIILNLKVNSMSRDLERHYVSSTNSSRETYKTLALVSYGVGAACVAGGALLYYLGWRPGGAVVALVPAVAPGEVGALLGGSF